MLQTARHCLSPTQPLFLQEFSTPTGLSLLTMSGFCAARPRLLMSSLLIKQAFPFQYLHWTALATLVDSLLLSLLHRLSSLCKPYGPWVLSPSPSSSPHPYLACLICSQDVHSPDLQTEARPVPCVPYPRLHRISHRAFTSISNSSYSKMISSLLPSQACSLSWVSHFSGNNIYPMATQKWGSHPRHEPLLHSHIQSPTSWQLLTPKYLSTLSSSPTVGYHQITATASQLGSPHLFLLPVNTRLS